MLVSSMLVVSKHYTYIGIGDVKLVVFRMVGDAVSSTVVALFGVEPHEGMEESTKLALR